MFCAYRKANGALADALVGQLGGGELRVGRGGGVNHQRLDVG